MENRQILPPFPGGFLKNPVRVVLAALMLILSAGLIVWMWRNQVPSEDRSGVSGIPAGEEAPVVRENVPPIDYKVDKTAVLELTDEGLPVGWKYQVPLYADSTALGAFSVGGVEGIYLGTREEYSLVGQFYQTLSDVYPEWRPVLAYEDDGETFLTYEYANEVIKQKLRVVVYNSSQEGYATTYSVSVEITS